MPISLNKLLKRHWLVALAMGTAGFGLNGFGLPVFGSTEILFGGFATLLTTYWLGPWWGATATALAFSRVWLIWGHPAGVVCFTLEALVVGWLLHRRRLSPLLAACGYWMFVGVPLAIIMLVGDGAIPFPDNWALVLKYPFNGLLMAFAALPVYYSRGFRLRAGLPLDQDADMPLQRVLLRRFGLIIALPVAALGLLTGRHFDLSTREQARQELLADSQALAHELQSHLDRHERALYLVAGANLGTEAGDALLAQRLERIRALYPGFLRLRAFAPDTGTVAAAPGGSALPALWPEGRPAGSGRAPRLSPVFRTGGPDGDLVVTVAAPWLDASDHHVGTIEGLLSLNRVVDDIGRTARLAGRNIVIVDDTQRVVATQGALHLPLLAFFGLDPLHAAAHEGDGATFLLEDDRTGRLERFAGARQRVPGCQWEIYLTEPVWPTQRIIAAYYLFSLLGTTATAGLALLLTRGMAGEITQPFVQLLATVRSLAGQNGGPLVPPALHASRELSEISRELHGVALTFKRNNQRLTGAITERDRTHEQLRQVLVHLEEKVGERTRELEEARRSAESANEAKSEFLASMSHELRTPLNVIVGMSELVAERHLGPLNERQAEGVHSIHESGRHLLELINDILDLSKIEAGMLDLHVQPVGVAALCEASIRFVREAAHKKGIAINTSIAPWPEVFMGDERRLKQVLVNLLANAVKFTPADGRIGLTVKPAANASVLRFEVWDTGIGIAPEHFEQIFQPFRQIDSSLSRQYGGTGLGLALVRRMVQLHGGTVEVQSETGRGTRFSLTLPVVLPPAAGPALLRTAASTPPFPAGSALPARILIAEDNESNNAVYAAFFNARGCELIQARNGREAVQLAARHQPDLVLMDVHMPEMDGLEAIRRLRAEPATELLPIIAVTALAMPEDRVRCLEAGANAYLSKPVKLQELARLVTRYSTRTANALSTANAP